MLDIPKLLDVLNSVGIEKPVICSSINKIGFRMSSGTATYETAMIRKSQIGDEN